jgi:flagellar M-ring protein FliF
MLESILGRSVSPRQMAMVGVGVVVTALVVGISNWATKPEYVPLFLGLPQASVGEMRTKLTESNIDFKLDELGTGILVNEKQQAEARVELAQAGLPNAGTVGMELFDRQTWGMTDFTQKVNYGRALEGELTKTISKMRDVKDVQVHLALEEESLFKKDQRPSKASVTLAMNGGTSPSQEVVDGIQSLVAGSIGGLDPNHVTVLDERGHALATDDDGSIGSQTNRQLRAQRETEIELQKKAEALLHDMYGTGGSKVRVTALLNFDQIARSTKVVDPDKQALTSEQKAEVLPSNPAQGAGYTTIANGYVNSIEEQNIVQSVGTIKKLTVAVLIADKVTRQPMDTVTKITPEPVITARTPEELARAESVIRSALMVDSLRGDMITVVSAPFDMPKIEPVGEAPKQTFVQMVNTNLKLAVWGAAVVVLLLLAVVALVLLKPKKQKEAAPQPQLAAAPSYPELPSSAQMAAALELHQQQSQQSQFPQDEEMETVGAAPRQVVLPAIAISAEREQAIATVDQRPEAAVRVTRNWLRS